MVCVVGFSFSIPRPAQNVIQISFRLVDRPISYLYNTLHFYERKLRDRPSLKRHLVTAVIQSLADIRPANWALSEQYQMYVKNPETEGTTWQPDLTYYIALIRRIADSKCCNHRLSKRKMLSYELSDSKFDFLQQFRARTFSTWVTGDLMSSRMLQHTLSTWHV